jgi:hypothetical protein
LKVENLKLSKKTIVFNAVVLFFLIALLVSLVFGFKTVKNKAIFFLSNPIDLESVIITPEGFEAESLLRLTWASISVKFLQGTELFFKNPKISLDPKLTTRRELLNISIDSVHVKVVPDDSNSTHTIIEGPLSHPDLWLPFRVSIDINKIGVDVKNIGSWTLDSFVASKSGRVKRVAIRARNIKGDHLVKNLYLNAEYRWNSLFGDASITVSDRTSDSLTLVLNAPRLRLEDLSAEINANVANLPLWLQDKWPSEAPGIGKITLHSNASLNALSGRADFSLTLKTRIGELWQLPAFDAAITASGNNSGISQSEILLRGNNGESIRFKGNINTDLDGSGELEAKGINITLADEVLPTDVKIHRVTKKGNTVSANFTTGAGSNFTARIADINNPVITFSADINSEEPWAVQWCGDMLKLANPTILTGSFSIKETLLKAELKTKVPYAYYATADEFEVSLWLNSEGIHFPKGTIKRKGYESNFTGRVMWDEEYFTFKLNQPSGGEAEIYGTFDPKIDLELTNINTLELPFADTTMLRGHNGIVSGNWSHDFENEKGNASVFLSTTIQNFALNASADVEMFGDALKATNVKIAQGERRIEGALSILLPSETRKKVDLLQANLNIADMNLVSILALAKDSTLSNGYANGGLEYSKEHGFYGNIIFTQIALAGLDPNTIRFPNIYLEATGDSIQISNNVFLGYDSLWNGVLRVVAKRPKDKGDLPVSLSYAVKKIDNEGRLLFNGFVSRDLKNVFGNTQVLGDWFLPEGIGEIKNADINIFARTAIGKNILDSLTANFSTGQNVYEKDIFKIPFTLNGRVRRGMLFVDSALIYSPEQNNERMKATLQFDLNRASIRDLAFDTKQFTMSLPHNNQIQIQNVTGKTALDSTGVTIFADLPAIYYNMKSPDYGTAEAVLKGQVRYRIPFHIGQLQTNPSITGNFEISKANYQKSIEIIPDPFHINREWGKLTRTLANLGREKRGGVSERALTSRPTILDVRVQTGREAAIVNTSVAEFAFVADVSVTGTTTNILLSGDLNAISGGKVGHRDLTMFDLSSFRVFWRSSPVKQGDISLNISNDYKFCIKDETCKVSVDVTGSLASLNVEPVANCAVEASPMLVYYSMLLGCISENYEESIDRDKFVGKMVGKAMASNINHRIFGGKDVVGDIDFKWKWLNEEKHEEDTNYVRIPISLSQWVKNLELILGYTNTNENSSNPRYDQSYEIGLRYEFDVFDPEDINRNLLDPSLGIKTNLVARRYLTSIETAENDTRLEKNVGLAYSHKFWDPCILGIGRCRIP